MKYQSPQTMTRDFIPGVLKTQIPDIPAGTKKAKRINRMLSYSLLIKAQLGAKIKWT